MEHLGNDEPVDAGPTFDEMVRISEWESMEDFLATADARILGDVQEAVRLRERLRDELLSSAPEIQEQICRVSAERQEWALTQLFGGQVCAVDGTLSRSPSISGGRARIGVVATSYSGDRIQRVLYVSYRQMCGPITSAMDYFARLKKVNRASELLLRAVMAYAERALALQRPEVWRFVHGELLPFELWAALGRDRPLCSRLELAQRLIENKHIIAVIEGSQSVELLNAGELLGPGEYLDARDLKAELAAYRRGRQADGRAAHFSAAEGAEFDAFTETFGPDVRVGIFKAGFKTYVFQAHRDVFHDAAALIIADARCRPLRGFPLLIDYADHICAHHLDQTSFDRQIQFKLARQGMEILAAEIDPRKTRSR